VAKIKDVLSALKKNEFLLYSLPVFVCLGIGFDFLRHFLVESGFVHYYLLNRDPFYGATSLMFWLLNIILIAPFFGGKSKNFLIRFGLPIRTRIIYYLATATVYIAIAVLWGERVMRPAYHGFAYNKKVLHLVEWRGITSADLVAAIDTIMHIYYITIGTIIISYFISVTIFITRSKR